MHYLRNKWKHGIVMNRISIFNTDMILFSAEEESPAVFRNIRKARQVWGSLGKMQQREGAELAATEKFY